MEHRSSQGRISTGIKDSLKILHRTGTAGGNNRYGQRSRQGVVELQVKASLFAISVHGIDADFTGPQGHALLSPFHDIETRILAAAIDIDLPAALAIFFRIDGEDYALAAIAFCRFPAAVQQRN